MKQCKRCNEINPGEVHTCTPGMRDENGEWLEKFFGKQKEVCKTCNGDGYIGKFQVCKDCF